MGRSGFEPARRIRDDGAFREVRARVLPGNAEGDKDEH